ncbi:MAG: hypothetical protein WAO74_00275 [Polaribacter sp.]|uniref:hypothetical protein n=1 Tax=Polaribacter sp. TaxID=1920175 RepID=UPI003BAEDB5D
MKLFASERTLYVDNFSNILGSPTSEDKLLSFAKKYNFTTLILYELNKVDKRITLSDPRKNNVLAEFISKAKNKYYISKIGASGECASFFTNTINVYNKSREKNEEKFDIYNLEYEYWSKKASGIEGYYCVNYLEGNSIPCNREGSFDFFVENLKELKEISLDNKNPIQIEAYVGYFTQNEINKITQYCDRLLIHAFGKNPRVSYEIAKNNLENLLKITSKIKTSIMLSSQMDHLGYWFKFNHLDRAEELFFKEMNIVNSQMEKKLNLDGFSYHSYSDLEKSVNYYSYTRN